MSVLRLSPGSSVLVVIDIQEAFLETIHEMPRVLRASEFLVRIAKLLNIPVLATVQNPDRLGHLTPALRELLPEPLSKMEFSAAANPGFLQTLAELNRSQVVLVGIETHICVSQTAVDLIAQNYEVAVCPDAVSSRTNERHKLGMERIRDSGVLPIHSEAVAYEWLQTAANPAFREALKLVKQFSPATST